MLKSEIWQTWNQVSRFAPYMTPIASAKSRFNWHRHSRNRTCIIPLASTSKETSTCGVPRGAGGIPESSNFPRRRLSRVIERSPSKTWHMSNGICTVGESGSIVGGWCSVDFNHMVNDIFSVWYVQLDVETLVRFPAETSRYQPYSTFFKPRWPQLQYWFSTNNFSQELDAG